jgi:hypothetical protein
VQPELIMKLTGHKSRDAFERYVKVTNEEAAELVMETLNNQPTVKRETRRYFSVLFSEALTDRLGKYWEAMTCYGKDNSDYLEVKLAVEKATKEDAAVELAAIKYKPQAKDSERLQRLVMRWFKFGVASDAIMAYIQRAQKLGIDTSQALVTFRDMLKLRN